MYNKQQSNGIICNLQSANRRHGSGIRHNQEGGGSSISRSKKLQKGRPVLFEHAAVCAGRRVDHQHVPVTASR